MHWFRPGPEADSFYSEIDLEVTFENTLQNRKPQMPSSGAWHCLFALYYDKVKIRL